MINVNVVNTIRKKRKNIKKWQHLLHIFVSKFLHYYYAVWLFMPLPLLLQYFAALDLKCIKINTDEGINRWRTRAGKSECGCKKPL